jgi:hypothetical protein
MARLFTAIGETGQVPAGFLEGVMSVLYNKGDPNKQPGNYRPIITLLCSNYRLSQSCSLTAWGLPSSARLNSVPVVDFQSRIGHGLPVSYRSARICPERADLEFLPVS